MAHQMDPAIQEEIKAIPGNDACVDCGTKNPQWASVSYGTLFCLECSGQHSVTMDSWTDKQIQSMRLGGNRKLIDWFKAKGVNVHAPISEKYNTDAAELYRLRLAAMRDGKPVPDELPPKPQANAPASASSLGSDRPMTGFGSQPPPRSASDPFDDLSKTANELSKTASQTFSMLAGTFSAVGKDAAEKLKEAKLSEKLSQTTEKLGETLKDPELAVKAQVAAAQTWQKVSASAFSLWKSVVEPSAQDASASGYSQAGSEPAYPGGDDDDEDDFETNKPVPVVKVVEPIRSASQQTTQLNQQLSAEDDDEWLQKQLSQVSATPPTAAAKPASGSGAASGKKNDDFFSEFGV